MESGASTKSLATGVRRWRIELRAPVGPLPCVVVHAYQGETLHNRRRFGTQKDQNVEAGCKYRSRGDGKRGKIPRARAWRTRSGRRGTGFRGGGRPWDYGSPARGPETHSGPGCVAIAGKDQDTA